MFVVGLTGNFGMGKSFVLSVFRGLGATILDTDGIVAHLLEEDRVVREIGKILGDDVLNPDGSANKKAIAGRIFGNNASRRKLEALLHPLVFKAIDRSIERINDKDCVVIIEVPLLFEGSHRERFRKVITVHTSLETAVNRLVQAGFSRSEAHARLKAQLPIEIKKAGADYTIDNSGTREETKRQVEEIYRSLTAEMKKKDPVRLGPHQ
jgi:dephospho-CoA kinase